MTPDKTSSLDLGCGKSPKNLFNADLVFGVDIRNDLEHGIVKADLALEPIPFPDMCFNFVTAHDFIEHVPRIIYMPTRRNCFVELMSEIWRVLKPGGRFLSVTPAYPNPAAFRDPTHVNIITDETFPIYFAGDEPAGVMYGFRGRFGMINQEWNGPYLVSILEKRELA